MTRRRLALGIAAALALCSAQHASSFTSSTTSCGGGSVGTGRFRGLGHGVAGERGARWSTRLYGSKRKVKGGLSDMVQAGGGDDSPAMTEEGIVDGTRAPAGGKVRNFSKGESISAELLKLCAASKRDVAAIAAAAQQLRSLGLEGAKSSALNQCWQCIYVSNDEALCSVGTGLHKLPLTRMEDMFITLSKGQIETVEVLRVIGPFPNLKNTLDGRFKITTPQTLDIKYTSLVDGTGKEVKSGSAATDRNVQLEIIFAGQDAMVVAPTGMAKDSILVFAPADLETELERLRVT